MHLLDEEKIETMHVYVYKEEPEQTTWWTKDHSLALFVSLIGLAGIITLCFIPNEPAYVVRMVSVPAHFLPQAEFKTTIAIIPTGSKTYPATHAYGTLTIYNGSILTQELPVGFIVASKNDVEVVTDSSVTIPPANPPSYGIATVSAHTAILGKPGNIAAYAINAVYGADLYIKNLNAFIGGVDQKTVTYATSSDTHQALINARLSLSTQRSQHQGLLAYPCKEHTAQKALSLAVSWVCQFVTFAPPPKAEVLFARLAGRMIILQIRMTVTPRKGLPGK